MKLKLVSVEEEASRAAIFGIHIAEYTSNHGEMQCPTEGARCNSFNYLWRRIHSLRTATLWLDGNEGTVANYGSYDDFDIKETT